MGGGNGALLIDGGLANLEGPFYRASGTNFLARLLSSCRAIPISLG